MIDKKEQKVSLLNSLSEKIAPLNYHYDTEEKSIIRRILGEEKWRLLNEDEKQSRRKSSISLGKKWSEDHFLGINEKADYSYDECIVVIYDLIRQTLSIIDTIQDDLNTDLLRVKAFFLIEKDFIDESFKSNKHLPLEIFENLANTLAESYPDLKLDIFYSLYSLMYKKWSNKPK
jgi:hypothetical protein